MTLEAMTDTITGWNFVFYTGNFFADTAIAAFAIKSGYLEKKIANTDARRDKLNYQYYLIDIVDKDMFEVKTEVLTQAIAENDFVAKFGHHPPKYPANRMSVDAFFNELEEDFENKKKIYDLVRKEILAKYNCEYEIDKTKMTQGDAIEIYWNKMDVYNKLVNGDKENVKEDFYTLGDAVDSQYYLFLKLERLYDEHIFVVLCLFVFGILFQFISLIASGWFESLLLRAFILMFSPAILILSMLILYAYAPEIKVWIKKQRL